MKTIKYQSRQSGAVLIMVLILTTVMLIIGVSGSQIIASNEIITGNFVDRSMAFQDAEAALVMAENKVSDMSGDIADEDGIVYNCIENTCESTPPEDGYNFVAWTNMSNDNDENNILRSGLMSQYLIERMSVENDVVVVSEFKDGSKIHYNNQPGESADYVTYRITARSNNPKINASLGRSVVILQSMIRKPVSGS